MQSVAEKHFELAVGLATAALRSLIIFNGGAAVALIALIGSIVDAHFHSSSARPFLISIIAFGTAAFFAVAATIVGYFSQLAYVNHLVEHSKNYQGLAAKRLACHHAWQRLAIVLVALSLAFSAIGLASGWCAAIGA